MVRRFSDPVEVRVRGRAETERGLEQDFEQDFEQGTLGDAERPRPEAFIWKGRLYVVRGVLAHWRERRAWWREALDVEESQVQPGRSIAAAASEQQLWRVEASPGWSFTPGVYDLAHDEGARDGSWSLIRVAD